MTMTFEQIKIEPAYRKVAARLTEHITDRTLATGERLPGEIELARQFGVNRSTIREALRELEGNGLLARARGSKCMVVARPDHDHTARGVSRALALHDVTFHDVWEALTIFEPTIAELAARRRSPEDLRKVLITAQAFVAGNADTAAAVHYAAEFFRGIGRAAANPVLLLAQEPLLQLLETSLQSMIDKVPQARQRIATAHKRIGEALRDKDPAAARTWMAKHIKDFRRGYEIAGIDLSDGITAWQSVP